MCFAYCCVSEGVLEGDFCEVHEDMAALRRIVDSAAEVNTEEEQEHHFSIGFMLLQSVLCTELLPSMFSE